MSDFFNDILKGLDDLTEEQLNELMSRLEVKKSGQSKNKGTTKEPSTSNDTDIIACIHCGSVDTKKHGKYNGKQRFFCKDCKKTFTPTTNKFFHHSKLNEAQWKELLRGMIENLSLTKIAENVDISVSAAWYNQKKILYMLAEMFTGQDNFVDIAECDEYSVHLSFKGKRDPEFFVKQLGRMPRHHRTRAEKIEYLQKHGLWEELQRNPDKLEELLTGDAYISGTNRDSVCILTGKDRSGNLYLDPACVGSIESRHVEEMLAGRFAEDAILVTDSNHSYKSFAELENIHHELVLASKHANGPYNLGRINSIHSKLNVYWSNDAHKLPATKYLDLSLILFWWMEKNSNLSTAQKVDKLYEYICAQDDTATSYESLQNRRLPLDTKGLLPDRV